MDTVAKASLRVADSAASGPPGIADLIRLPGALSPEQTSMMDNARRMLQTGIDQILLAALARVLAEVLGEGVVAVDLTGAGRSVLKPDVDLRRTIGWFSTLYPVAVSCVGLSGASATQLLDDVGQTMTAVPHYGIGYGILRYLHAPTARLFEGTALADIHLSDLGMLPEWQNSEAPVGWDSDSERTVRDTPPGLGHAVEIRAYRLGGALHVDWWYDCRRVSETTIGAVVERFVPTLMGLLEEAIGGLVVDDEGADDVEALALVDLSAAVLDDED